MPTRPARSPLSPERLLAGCDAEQAEAVTTTDSPLLVLAGAGSGKTRVLTRRIAWRVLHESALASHVLALTFTRKAAGELRERLGALGLPEPVRAGTFHAVALQELKRLAAERRALPPVVVSSKVRLLEHVTSGWAPRLRWNAEGGRSKARPGRSVLGEGIFPLAELAQEIEWAKARCLGPDDYVRAAAAAGRSGTWPPSLVAEAFSGYELEKRRRKVLDFEDLLLRCADEIEADHEFAASARWRIRHLFVDEYQDVNEAQLRLLRAWLGGRDDLCVVGDPDQAIYAWNGSDPEAIRRFPEEFAGARVLRLTANYRSTEEVLGVAAAVLGRGAPAPSAGLVGAGPVPSIEEYATDLEEAEGVAAGLRLAKRPGRSWSQCAVLARTNAQLAAFEGALGRRQIPFRRAGGATIGRSDAVQAALRVLGRTRSRAELVAAAADLAAEAGRLAEGEGLGGGEGLAPAEGFAGGGGVRGAGAGEGGSGAGEGASGAGVGGSAPPEASELAELARLVDDYLAEDVSPTGAGFRNWFDSVARSEDRTAGGEAVTLATFHRAKGLEWPVVFLVGLEDGLVPIAHALDGAALAEERRLLYVACTRAAEELHCSFARERSFGAGGRPVARTPSPFVAAMEAARRQLAGRPSSARLTAREAIAESRRLLGVPDVTGGVKREVASREQ